jgi:hypothetical protein
MKKSHLSALPLALMLLFGWSCSHSKTPKQPAEKNCISDCYVTDSNRTAINVDSLQNVGCYNITMTWQERLLSVYTANYAGKQVSEFVIGLFPPQGRKPDLKATRKVVFWGSEGKWDSKTGRVFTFPDGSDLEIGLRYLGGPTIFLKRRNRIQNCPTHRKRLCAIKMTLQENRPESDSGRFLICALSIRKGPDVSKTRPFSISGFRRGRPIETPRAAVCLLIGVNYGLFRHCFEIVLITIRDAGRLFLQLILSYPATFL